MRKNLYWVLMVLLVFACLRSGCGGSGGSDVAIDGNNGANQNQQQNNTPNVPETPTTPETPTIPETPTTPETPTSPDIPTTPETPTTPTPTSPDNPATPNTPTTPNNPTSPDNPATPNNPSAEFNMNGTWQIVSGEVRSDCINFPEISHTSRYIEGSAPAFDISVSKNSDNEYYTVKLSGEGVFEETKGNLTYWGITVKGDSDNPRVTAYLLIMGINAFTHPEANYYFCDDTEIMSTITTNGLEDMVDNDFAEGSFFSFRSIDNDTIIYHTSNYMSETTLSTGITAEISNDMTLTLKRVQ